MPLGRRVILLYSTPPQHPARGEYEKKRKKDGRGAERGGEGRGGGRGGQGLLSRD